MNDFVHWTNWFNSIFPDHGYNFDELKQAYDKHYSCNCGTCLYRKENGFAPIMITGECNAPFMGISSPQEVARLLKA